MSHTLHHAIGILVVASTALLAQESRNFEVDIGAARRATGNIEIPPQNRRVDVSIPAFTPNVWLGENQSLAWLALDDRADDKPPAAMGSCEPPHPDVGAKERWLMNTVRNRFKGVTAAEVVERSTVRNDGVNRAVTRERGVEVKGSKEAVGEVRGFFDRFSKVGSQKVVTLEIRVLDTGTRADSVKSSAALSTRAAYDDRVRELTTRGAQSMMSPTIKVLANQTASASAVEQISYIKDYQLEILPGQKIADPVIDVVNDGFSLELTPVFDPDEKTLIVAGNMKLSTVERPIREWRTKIGETEVTIQLPSVVTTSWSGEMKLAPGQDTFVITGLSRHPGGKDVRDVEVWCLVTLEDGAPEAPKGEIVDRDEKSGNVFVSFPAEAVPDDPWNKAPKEVAVYRRGEKIGTARLAGGWVLPSSPHPVVAIYQLAEGTPKDGDFVK